jgi:hypothetical protein
MAKTTAEHVFREVQKLLEDVKLLATCDHMLRKTEAGGRAADAIESALRSLSAADVALGAEIFGPPVKEPALKIIPPARRAKVVASAEKGL